MHQLNENIEPGNNPIIKKAGVRIIEFTQTFPGSPAKIEQVATYNESVIPEESVKDLIRLGMWVIPNPLVIFTTKEQHENVFGPIPEPE